MSLFEADVNLNTGNVSDITSEFKFGLNLY